MVIFSLGGWTLERHGRGHTVRCCTAVLPVGGDGDVVLDPFPQKGSRAVVSADGAVRVWRDGEEVAAAAPSRVRWNDHELVAFVAETLRDWLVTPVASGRDGEVHHDEDLCDFDGVRIATRRRTTNRHGFPVLWADVVAAHVIPSKPDREVLN